MEKPSLTTDVVIVGAGPVGLMLACCLLHNGITCVILEKRPRPFRHTRAIGIHAASMRVFEKIGLADAMLEQGVRVSQGAAFSGGKCLGRLSFASCPPPYNFVLTVPQYESERILESSLASRDPACLQRGTVIESFAQRENDVCVAIRGTHGPMNIEGRYVVGCDGRESAVRKRAEIAFPGGPYADTFVMGDFADTTDFGNEARLFLDVHGLVESFPLPGKLRRWVVQTDEFKAIPDETEFIPWVRERSGVDLTGQQREVLTPFRVHHFLASSFVAGRTLLAGDAAHVMSPIGGQGMNVGWLDAWDIAEAMKAILRTGGDAATILGAY
ncbi:MAG TPA: NAD(P)/FAD-dependent oxidoreductase, partial [Kiritimatiellia bacterium]